MIFHRNGALLFGSWVVVCLAAHAQDLTPRAYLITPVKTNAVTLSYLFSDGEVLFDPSLPIVGTQGEINTSIFSIYHSLNFFGRSANFTASLPYSVGTFSAEVAGVPQSVYRSGLMDSIYRLSINLKGGAAMSPREFAKWRQKTVIGASVKIVAPTGQYDPARLINQGTNRWAFKPEVGVSQRWGRWILDGYAAVWFFTHNNQFYTGQNRQIQRPMGAFETHLSYDFKPRLWVSFDGNFWVGGRSVVNDVVNLSSLQKNSRIGVTASFPINRFQSFKVSYSNGAYIVYGGAYRTFSVAWQYGWIGKKIR